MESRAWCRSCNWVEGWDGVGLQQGGSIHPHHHNQSPSPRFPGLAQSPRTALLWWGSSSYFLFSFLYFHFSSTYFLFSNLKHPCRPSRLVIILIGLVQEDPWMVILPSKIFLICLNVEEDFSFYPGRPSWLVGEDMQWSRVLLQQQVFTWRNFLHSHHCCVVCF